MEDIDILIITQQLDTKVIKFYI